MPPNIIYGQQDYYYLTLLFRYKYISTTAQPRQSQPLSHTYNTGNTLLPDNRSESKKVTGALTISNLRYYFDNEQQIG